MHEVQRSPEPGFFDDLRARYAGWNDMDGSDRRLIREALAQDFGHICAYCQQPCSPPSSPSADEDKDCNPVRPGRSTDEETIDHFRPRSRFQICGLTGLTWSMPATDATRANATNGLNLTTMPMVFWLLFTLRIRPYRSTLAPMPLHINELHRIFMTSALMPILERLLPRLSQPRVLRMADNSTMWNGQWLIGLFET